MMKIVKEIGEIEVKEILAKHFEAEIGISE